MGKVFPSCMTQARCNFPNGGGLQKLDGGGNVVHILWF